MALSDIPYATASWTAPGSDLTDYVGYVDLSDLPQSWWDEVDSPDGAKMRVAKDDAAEGSTSATELAFDVQNFDDVAQTGQVWFLWSGTLGSTSPDDVRVYPAKASASSYGVTDTFGRNAVWADFNFAYHFNEDPTGSITDVTGNGNSLTSVGSMTSGDLVDSTLGKGIQFDGSDDGLINDGGFSKDIAGFTHFILLKGLSSWNTNADAISEVERDSPFDGDNLSINSDFSFDIEAFFKGTSMGRVDLASTDTAYWLHFTRNDSNNALETYLDASAKGDGNTVAVNQGTQNHGISIGCNYEQGTPDAFSNIEVSEMWHRDGDVGADEISHQYSNQNDPAGFWGTWTLVNTGGGTVESSFSLNTTQSVASASQSTAEAGITIISQQGIADGSTATGESGMSLSTLLQIALSKQSVTDASFTLPTVHQVTTVSDTQIVNEASFSLALHKAITTQQISTIEVSYSLNTTQQAAIAFDATGEAAMSMNLSAGLSLVSTALAEAGISFDAVQSMTITGQSVGLNVTLSDGRTLTITLQNRTFAIPDEKRTMTINSENRTFTIT